MNKPEWPYVLPANTAIPDGHTVRVVATYRGFEVIGVTPDGWLPIKECPVGTEALFMGRLWRHPYWGIHNGAGGDAYLDGFDGGGLQVHDAAWWMPINKPPADAAVDPQAPK